MRAISVLVGLGLVLVVPLVTCRILVTHDRGDNPAASPPSREIGVPQVDQIADTLLDLYLKLQSGELDAPVSDDPTPVTFTVHPGETAAEIAQRLENERLVRSAELFRMLLRVRGVDKELEAGDYTLRRNMTMGQIIAALRHGRPPTVTLTVPEGWRAEQIAVLLEALDLADPDEFLKLVRTGGGFDYDFLADRPDGVTALEGFLFPDTYEFESDASATDVIGKMLANFDHRFTPEMRQQATQQGLTIYQAVTLASIVEREAQLPQERPTIASVFHNRLSAGMHLNADPTVQYALGYQPDTQVWWKSPLLLEDLQVDSAYNTYVHVGLPPGPICNPGLATLEATVNPADTSYYYFVANGVAGDGSHVFAKTLEEHQANIERYRGSK